MEKLWAVAVGMLAVGCAHHPLAGADLDRVRRPAFVSRIEDEAGPRATVFRDDASYGGKLKKLEPKEADRRLQVKLAKGVTRFEISDRLRGATLAFLPQERPWTETADPAQVAGVLQSFLVEEVPANAPDYNLLKELGTDAVVEFVVEAYGMRSRQGRAGAFIKGYGRMFFIDGREEIWRRGFEEDDVESKRAHLDPFAVGKDPDLFRQRVNELVDRLATLFAKDLNPPDRRGGRSPKPGSDELKSAPDDTHRAGNRQKPKPPPDDDLPPGELPPPDAPH
jgi:hypothetical protein